MSARPEKDLSGLEERSQKACNLQVVSHSGSHPVILNSGTISQSSTGAGGGTPASRSLAGLVVATPLTSRSRVTVPVTSRSRVPEPPISKILIRVCPRGTKKDGKTFSLRNIDPASVLSVEKLRGVVKAQLQGEVTSDLMWGTYMVATSLVFEIRTIWSKFGQVSKKHQTLYYGAMV